MKGARISLAMMTVPGVLASAYRQEQEYSKANFDVGDGAEHHIRQGAIGSET